MKRILICLTFAAAFVACGDGTNTASEGYVDSSSAVPNSTVNPPDATSTGLDTMSSMRDTSMMGTDTMNRTGRDTTTRQ